MQTCHFSGDGRSEMAGKLSISTTTTPSGSSRFKDLKPFVKFTSLNGLLDAVEVIEASKMSTSMKESTDKSPDNGEPQSSFPRDSITYNFVSESFTQSRQSEDDFVDGPDVGVIGPSTETSSFIGGLTFTSMTGTAKIAQKVPRKRIDPKVGKALQNIFDAGNHFPSREERECLAERLSLTSRTIQIWFQNKRQALRNKRTLETDYECTKGSTERISDLLRPSDHGIKRHLSVDSNIPIPMNSLVGHVNSERRNSEPIATVHPPISLINRCSIHELTKISPRLPLPPNIVSHTQRIQKLPCKLPKIQHIEEPAKVQLPSIGAALRRSSLY